MPPPRVPAAGAYAHPALAATAEGKPPPRQVTATSRGAGTGGNFIPCGRDMLVSR